MSGEFRIESAEQWRLALEDGLAEFDGDDALVDYADVAAAFPSGEPHSLSFDLMRIDDSALRSWAHDHGWDASLAPDVLDEASGLPKVRFRRRAPAGGS